MSQQYEINFYNTIAEYGDTIEKSYKNVEKQADRILYIMREINKPLTPFEVSIIYDQRFIPVPITSIRRAMTDLTNMGKLMKTKDMKEGGYGKPNYKWQAI